MKAKIAFLLGNVASPVLQRGRVTHGMHSCPTERGLTAPKCQPPRPKLKIIWRTNPTNRRLECHWVVEGDAATDEGVSCGQLLRRAA
jgi:hypothetical protein